MTNVDVLRQQIADSRAAEADRRLAEQRAEAEYRAAHLGETPDGRRQLARQAEELRVAREIARTRAQQDQNLADPGYPQHLKDDILLTRATPEQAAELLAARQAERALDLQQQFADKYNPLAAERRAAEERAAGDAVLDKLAADRAEVRERRARVQAAIDDGPDAA